MKKVSLIFAWSALPISWVFIVYNGETFGYGRKLIDGSHQWNTALQYIFAVVFVFSVFFHLPSFLKEKEKSEGMLVVYYILSVITLGVYSYVRFATTVLKKQSELTIDQTQKVEPDASGQRR